MRRGRGDGTGCRAVILRHVGRGQHQSGAVGPHLGQRLGERVIRCRTGQASLLQSVLVGDRRNRHIADAASHGSTRVGFVAQNVLCIVRIDKHLATGRHDHAMQALRRQIKSQDRRGIVRRRASIGVDVGILGGHFFGENAGLRNQEFLRSALGQRHEDPPTDPLPLFRSTGQGGCPATTVKPNDRVHAGFRSTQPAKQGGMVGRSWALRQGFPRQLRPAGNRSQERDAKEGVYSFHFG